MRRGNGLSISSTWLHQRFFGGVCAAHLFYFLCCPIMCLYVLSSVTITALKRCSVRLYLQLFVGGIISYLRYLCLFGYSGVQHILCCIFVLFFFVLCKCFPRASTMTTLTYNQVDSIIIKTAMILNIIHNMLNLRDTEVTICIILVVLKRADVLNQIQIQVTSIAMRG